MSRTIRNCCSWTFADDADPPRCLAIRTTPRESSHLEHACSKLRCPVGGISRRSRGAPMHGSSRPLNTGLGTRRRNVRVGAHESIRGCTRRCTGDDTVSSLVDFAYDCHQYEQPRPVMPASAGHMRAARLLLHSTSRVGTAADLISLVGRGGLEPPSCGLLVRCFGLCDLRG